MYGWCIMIYTMYTCSWTYNSVYPQYLYYTL